MTCDITGDDVLSIAQDAVKETMPERGPGQTIQRCLEVAAFRLGISYSRAWSLYYGKARQVRAEEFQNIERRREIQRRQRIARLRAEIAQLEARIAEDDGTDTAIASPDTADVETGAVGRDIPGEAE